jgi:dihydrofolate reductase
VATGIEPTLQNASGRERAMSKVVLDVSVSLDGFIAGPAGDLERVHAWMFAETDPAGINRGLVEEFFETTGASVMGRGMWDAVDGPNGWGPNGWTHLDGTVLPLPVFVLTHERREAVTRGKTTFTFVADDIESVLERAKAAAGKRDVVLQGANIARQYLEAGLLDEIQLHLVPVLLGDGVRLFERGETGHVELERTEVLETPGVTHLRFRVVR